ncbi:hypothetical protein [Thermovibrio sp.]
MISLGDAKFVSLSAILARYSKTKVRKFLKTFRCPRNDDIEDFLHRKAIKFELAGLARTYLWYSERPLQVIAYFTIALKAISLDENVLKAIEEKSGDNFDDILGDLLKGFSLGQHNRQIPVYLIGQVGKSPHVKKLQGYLVKVALKKIYEASEIVGGKIVVLDVIKKGKYLRLLEHYKSIDFKELYEFSSRDSEIIRLYYKLPSPDEAIDNL